MQRVLIIIFICSVQKDPQKRMSSLELLVSIISLSFNVLLTLNMLAKLSFHVLFQSHPFIQKFEDKDINLGVLVDGLEPPVNFQG